MRSALFCFFCIVLSGCGIPRDMEGTLDRARGGELRVGVSPNPPWVVIEDGKPSGGVETELVKQFADKIDSQVVFTTGTEGQLFAMLAENQLDVVLAGLTDDTPWTEIGLTRWYVQAYDPIEDKERNHVWAVAAGENRLLLEIDRFLQVNRAKAMALLNAAQAAEASKQATGQGR